MNVRTGRALFVPPAPAGVKTLTQIAADLRAANAGRSAVDVLADFEELRADLHDDRRGYDERDDFLDWCAAGRGPEHPRHVDFPHPEDQLGHLRPA